MAKKNRYFNALFQKMKTFDDLLAFYFGGALLGFIGCIVMVIAIDNNLDNGWFQPVWGQASYFMKQYLKLLVASFLLFLIPWFQKKLWRLAIIMTSLSTLISAYIWIPFVLLILEDNKVATIPHIIGILMIIAICIGIMEILFIWHKQYTMFTTKLLYVLSGIVAILIAASGILGLIVKILFTFRILMSLIPPLVTTYRLILLFVMPYLSLAFVKMATYSLAYMASTPESGGLKSTYTLKALSKKITLKSVLYKIYRIFLHLLLFIAAMFTNVIILDFAKDDFIVSLILLSVAISVLLLTTKLLFKSQLKKKTGTKIYMGICYMLVVISIIGRMMDDTPSDNGFQVFINNQNYQVQVLIIFGLIVAALLFLANIGHLINKLKISKLKKGR